MMTFEYAAQALGIFASVLIILAYSQKSDVRFKAFVMLGGLVFAYHFYLLGAYAGMAVNFINFFLAGASIRFRNSNILVVSFILLYMLAGFITYENPVDILPAFAGTIFTFSMFKLSGIQLRLCLFVASGSWLIYAIIYQSIGSIITELFAQTTNAITVFRLYKDKKTKAI